MPLPRHTAEPRCSKARVPCVYSPAGPQPLPPNFNVPDATLVAETPALNWEAFSFGELMDGRAISQVGVSIFDNEASLKSTVEVHYQTACTHTYESHPDFRQDPFEADHSMSPHRFYPVEPADLLSLPHTHMYTHTTSPSSSSRMHAVVFGSLYPPSNTEGESHQYDTTHVTFHLDSFKL